MQLCEVCRVIGFKLLFKQNFNQQVGKLDINILILSLFHIYILNLSS